MAKKFKLGIIGLGMGQAHLTAITQHLDDIEAVAAADIDKKRLKTVGDTFCIPRRFTDYREMLELDEIEAVLVVTPNAFHAPMAIDAMNAGKHVLVEKPPSVDVDGAKRMLATSKKTRKKLMYGFSCRFRADVQTAKDLADRGALGEMYYGKTSWVRRYGIPYSSSFCIRATSGGGPLIDLGVHALDMTWFIMGSPKPVSVVGATYDPFMKKLARKGYDVEDLAAAFIRFANGATILVETSWASYVDHEDISSRVLGTKAGIDLKLNAKDNEKHFNFYTSKDGTRLDCTSAEVELKVKDSGLAKQLRHFVDCIRKNKQNISTGEEGIDLMKMLTAVYKSAETGKEVVLNRS